MYHQLNLWINELQTQFNLSIDQIVALSGIARATFTVFYLDRVCLNARDIN